MEDLYPTPLEIPIKLHTFLTFFALTEPTTPKEIPISSVEGVWMFSGTAQSGFVYKVHDGSLEKTPNCDN